MKKGSFFKRCFAFLSVLVLMADILLPGASVYAWWTNVSNGYDYFKGIFMDAGSKPTALKANIKWAATHFIKDAHPGAIQNGGTTITDDMVAYMWNVTSADVANFKNAVISFADWLTDDEMKIMSKIIATNEITIPMRQAFENESWLWIPDFEKLLDFNSRVWTLADWLLTHEMELPFKTKILFMAALDDLMWWLRANIAWASSWVWSSMIDYMWSNYMDFFINWKTRYDRTYKILNNYWNDNFLDVLNSLWIFNYTLTTLPSECESWYEVDATTHLCVKSTVTTQTADCDTSKLPANAEAVKWTFTQTWDWSKWVPASKDWSTSGDECTYKCKENYELQSDGSCKAKTQTANCDTSKLPANAESVIWTFTQTWNWTKWDPETKEWTTDWTECKYKCKEGYDLQSDGSCKKHEEQPTTQTANCDTSKLPAKAAAVIWTFTQTWDWTKWTPATKSWSTEWDECVYKCKEGFDLQSDGSCKKHQEQPTTQTVNCDTSKLPANADIVKWTFTQTWNWTSWTPATKAWSTDWDECVYKCKEGFDLQSDGSCKKHEDIPTTQTVDCDVTKLPANSDIVNWKFTQTWNWTSWTPATKAWSTDWDECTYKCKENYELQSDGSCVAKTQTVDCDESTLPANADIVKWTFIQTWNWTNWTPATKNWSTIWDECVYKCKEGYDLQSDGSCEEHIEEKQTRTMDCDITTLPYHSNIIKSIFTQTWNWEKWEPDMVEWNTDWDECVYECKDGFDLQPDGTCEKHIEEEKKQTVDCDLSTLPENAEVIVGTFTQIWIIDSWNPITKLWSTTGSECLYKCKEWYQLQSDGSCVAKTQKASCNMATLPGNAEVIDWGFTQTWDWSNWTPATKAWSTDWDGCTYKCMAGYELQPDGSCVENWFIEIIIQTASCDANTLPANADVVIWWFLQTWEWGKWNPAMVPWTTDWTECVYKCKVGYTLQSDGSCLEDWKGPDAPKTQKANCDTSKLPANADAVIWTFTQTWDWTNWTPITKDWSTSWNECTYKCKDGFDLLANGKCAKSSDDKKTQTVKCDESKLTANADAVIWTFTQTWDWTNWTPTTKDWSTSGNECIYKCKDGFDLQSDGSCVKSWEEKKTQKANCDTSKLTANADVVNWTFTQTWDWSNWTPATKDWSTSGSECTYKCKDNYDLQSDGTCKAKSTEEPAPSRSYSWGGGRRSSSSSTTKTTTTTDNKNTSVNNTTGSKVENTTGSKAIEVTTGDKVIEVKESANEAINLKNAIERNWVENVVDSKCSIDSNVYSSDIQKWYVWACENGLTSSTRISEARLNQPVTRAALAKMLWIYARDFMWKVTDEDVYILYKDVNQYELGDSYEYIQQVYQLGLMWVRPNGFPTKNFRPMDNVTLTEFSHILSRLIYWTDADWAIDSLVNKGVISKAEWNNNLSRWEIMKMLYASI